MERVAMAAPTVIADNHTNTYAHTVDTYYSGSFMQSKAFHEKDVVQIRDVTVVQVDKVDSQGERIMVDRMDGCWWKKEQPDAEVTGSCTVKC